MPLKPTLNPRRGSRCRSLTPKEKTLAAKLMKKHHSKRSISRFLRCHSSQLDAVLRETEATRDTAAVKRAKRRKETLDLSQIVRDLSQEDCGKRNHMRYQFSSNVAILAELKKAGIQSSKATVFRDLEGFGVRRSRKANGSTPRRGQRPKKKAP